ncbi:MAG TPA: proline--tRNA ligase [Gaiellaceae bacterium]|nr:proline--tRNA ligase [Gaiellaceae bacterium]
MIHRASQLFLPTLREPPADAEAASHQLLVRGGFIRQIGAGLWSFLPLGWRVHMRIEQIIREEMEAIGGQEMLCPTLTPAELWETTGRIAVPILFHLNDSGGRPFVLSWTHEESMTFIAREIQSYKQLPQVWFHFSTKDRDEPRPRGGLLRVREFVMKDAYTFDADEDGLAAAFDRQAEAYARIFERCGLEAFLVEAESGAMGGKSSLGFLAPTGSGENELMRCENGDYFADIEAARGKPRPAELPEALGAPERIETPGIGTIEELAAFLGIAESATSKALPVVAGDRLVLALVRGDDRLSPEKLETFFEGAFRPATDEEIRAAFGAGGGSLGPVGVDVEVVADEALREGQYVAGANEDGWHLRGVEAGRDYEPTFADIRQAVAGDACPECGGTLRVETAVEVGHIFKLGTFHSSAFGATFLDEDGREKPLVMGSYGIGLARTMAAVVEQSHDENGIVWPRSIAPYDAHVVVLPGAEEIAERAAEALSATGLEVLLDDRDQRAGEKFADADLIGCPIRVTAGKKSLEDGKVDVRDRATGAEKRLDVADLGKESG